MKTERFLIDTNIFILLFNDQLVEPIPSGNHFCSVITEIELLSFPSLTSDEEALIRERLTDLTIYDIDQSIKEETIRLRRTRQVKLPDAIIAATAIVHDATLVTNDVGFQGVPGLTCQTLAQKE